MIIFRRNLTNTNDNIIKITKQKTLNIPISFDVIFNNLSRNLSVDLKKKSKIQYIKLKTKSKIQYIRFNTLCNLSNILFFLS